MQEKLYKKSFHDRSCSMNVLYAFEFTTLIFGFSEFGQQMLNKDKHNNKP
ncbi:hypothetical protein JCM19237_4620 [Photobacterium aphoticum]|uniref:Uncharacterized protein n=1 Tax=Photobacterium aphoticum TaxID=754436 RepID=A0A090QZA8_9GAMM|nr:hypothetical protein JCM19237_4620 [Photobacterium aphoticum]